LSGAEILDASHPERRNMPAGIRLRQNSIDSPKTHVSTLADLK